MDTTRRNSFQGNKVPNTPNKPFRSPNQRFQQRNNGPPGNKNFQNRSFNNQQNRPFSRPFNGNQQNKPFSRPFNANPRFNKPFNGNQQASRPFNGNQQNPRFNRPFNANQQNPRFSKPFNGNQQNRPFNKPFNGPRPTGIKRKAPGEKKDTEIRFDPPEKRRRTIFVGNVPLDTTDKQLKDLFKKFGTVESVRFRGIPRADIRQSPKVAHIKKAFNPNRTSMDAYVVFSNKEEADKAHELNGHKINEHVIRVNSEEHTAPTTSEYTIYVGNLPFDAEDNQLIEKFKACGQIESVRVCRDKITQMGRGFGYVNFTTKDAVELALQMENVRIKNRSLRIIRSDSVADHMKNYVTVKVWNVPQHYKIGNIFRLFKHCGEILNIKFEKLGKQAPSKAAMVSFAKPKAATLACKLRVTDTAGEFFIRKDAFDPRAVVCIRNLPLTVERKQLKSELVSCGKINNIHLYLKPELPYTTGHAIVEFDSVKEATKALKLKSIKLLDEVCEIGPTSKISDEDFNEGDDNKNTTQQNGENADDSDDSDVEMKQEGDEDEDDDDDDDDEDEDEDEDSEEDDDDDKQEDGAEAEQDSDDDEEEDDDSDDEKEEQDGDDDDDDDEDEDDDDDDE